LKLNSFITKGGVEMLKYSRYHEGGIITCDFCPTYSHYGSGSYDKVLQEIEKLGWTTIKEGEIIKDKCPSCSKI